MTALLRYDAACRSLAEAVDLDEVRLMRDQADALRAAARIAKNKEPEVQFAEIRLRAERRLGEIIKDQKAAEGLNQGDLRRGCQMEPRDERPRLEDLGVDKKLSSRAQKLAAIPLEKFEAMLGMWRERVAQEHERVTVNLLREGERAGRRAEHETRAAGGKIDDLLALVATGFRASAILADPPWKFIAYSEQGEGRSAGVHYRTDAVEEIKLLPVAQLAAKDCVLFMWMVDWCPRWALDVIDAWGFEHKTTAFTWVKQNASHEGWHMGQGYWTRANPERCWLATRGNPTRIHADVRQLIVAPVMEHSRKPDEIHDRIERLVAGPYLELYARRERERWVTWGDELTFTTPLGVTAQRVVDVEQKEESGGEKK